MRRLVRATAAALRQLITSMPGLMGISMDIRGGGRLRYTTDTNEGACLIGAALGVPMVSAPTADGGWTMCGAAFEDGLVIEVNGPINLPLTPVQAVTIEQAIAGIRVAGVERQRPRLLTAETEPIRPLSMAALIDGNDDGGGET